jgi:hypothetical protein
MQFIAVFKLHAPLGVWECEALFSQVRFLDILKLLPRKFLEIKDAY